MTPDELKSMPKGQFVVMKTGFYPMKVRLKLFFQWGITFDEKHPYTVPEHGNREIAYASKAEIQTAIIVKYPPNQLAPVYPKDGSQSGQEPVHTPTHDRPYKRAVKVEHA